MNNTIIESLFCLVLLISFPSCDFIDDPINISTGKENIIFENRSIRLEFDDQMMVKIFRKSGDKIYDLIRNRKDPYSIIVNGSVIKNFNMDKSKVDIKEIENNYGSGRQLTLTGSAKGPSGSNI